jgi:hypothetical protein
MKHRAYTFRSIWHISAPLATVEKVIEDVENWPIWWKGLKSAQVISLEHTLLGSQAEMVWQGSGGYYLRLTLTITSYQKGKKISFDSTGDLKGSGSWSFMKQQDSTIMEILWDVSTTKSWMNFFAPLLRPIFIKNHSILMARGESGLQSLFKK